MNVHTTAHQYMPAVPTLTLARGSMLQGAYACGTHTHAGGACLGCKKKRMAWQRPSLSMRGKDDNVAGEFTPPVVHEVSPSPNTPLHSARRAIRESDFDHDFSHIPLRASRPSPKGILRPTDDARSPSPVELGWESIFEASLPLPLSLTDEDEIHRPLIESYRAEHGLPAGGVSETGERLGPSDAEIKYGGLLTSAAPSSSVFYVSFVNVAPPAAPDHSLANPGPSGATANRAGYTRVRIQKRMTIPWDTLPALSDGRVPFFAQSVNTFYRLDPIEVYVSSDYAVGSCPYRVTLEHERSHVNAFLQIFHAGRDSLVTELNGVSVPTRGAPRIAAPDAVETEQETIGENLRQAVIRHSAGLVSQMEADRNAKDSPASYARVYARCPAAEW